MTKGAAAGEVGRVNAARGLSVLDCVLRLFAIASTMASAIAMGTSNETLSFFTQSLQFRARFRDLPTLTFFVVTNAIVSGYLIISLALSIIHIVRSKAQNTRIVLILFDTVMLGLVTAGASAAAAIVYLAHKGNGKTNWLPICQQFNSFCQRTSGSLIGSFIAAVILNLLILLSAVIISRRS